MGQNISYYKPGTFNSNFKAAQSYNQQDKDGNAVGGGNYLQITSGPKQYETIMGIPAMLDNPGTDDFITYIMILQAVPMDKILNSTTLINNDWTFNVASDGKMNNKTGTGTNGANPTEIQDGEWYLTDRGRIDYKLNASSSNNNANQVFKCLADWFNKLDDLQNQYITAITNNVSVSQAFIQGLVIQAESISRNYSNLYNNLMQLQIAGDEMLSPVEREGRVLLIMNRLNGVTQEQRQIVVKIGPNGYIEKAQLKNGDVLYDKNGTKNTWNADNAFNLGFYAYTYLNLSTYHDSNEYHLAENAKKLWTFQFAGKRCILYYSPTALSPNPVFHIIPLAAFVSLIDKKNEGYRSVKSSIRHSDKKIENFTKGSVENFNDKLGAAMNHLQSENSDINQMLNTPRMQQFKKNIENGNIGKPVEGYTRIYK